MIQKTRRRHLVCFLFLVGILVGSISWAGPALGIGGRLIVRLEGGLTGPIPPTFTLTGPGRDESRTLDAISLAAHEIVFEQLEAGTYRAGMAGAAGVARPAGAGSAAGTGAAGDRSSTTGAAGETSVEIGIHEGLTTVLHAQIETGRLAIDPFRPDPFGMEDGWDAVWLDALPGAGEEGTLAAGTYPDAPRQTSIDGLDLVGSGFRQIAQVRGESMVRSVRSPLGLSPASEEIAVRRLLPRGDSPYAGLEGATGDRGRNSYEGSLGRRFPKLPWAPGLLLSLRGVNEADAAPSTFSAGEKLPNNGLKGFDLFSRVEAAPTEGTRLTGLLYGEGTQRKHFVEAFRHDTSHAPREDRASIEGGIRAVQQIGALTQIRGQIDLETNLHGDG